VCFTAPSRGDSRPPEDSLIRHAGILQDNPFLTCCSPQGVAPTLNVPLSGRTEALPAGESEEQADERHASGTRVARAFCPGQTGSIAAPRLRGFAGKGARCSMPRGVWGATATTDSGVRMGRLRVMRVRGLQEFVWVAEAGRG